MLAVLLRGLGGRGVGFGSGFEWWHYPLTACRAILTYLSLAVWPHPLVFDYGVDLGGPGIPEFVCAGLVLGLAGLTVVGWWRSPPLGFLAAWFFITLAPTSSIVPIPLQPIAENRVYLPLAGVVALLVWFIHLAARKISRLLWLALAVALGALTLARNTDYRSDIALWSDTVAKKPLSSRAHQNLGAAFNSRRDPALLADAGRHFSEALRLKPDYAEAMAAVGGILARQGRLEEGIEHCRNAIRLDPRTAEAYNNLGGALWEKRDLAGAIEAYDAAAQLRPGFTEAYVNLANVLLQAGRMAEAIQAGEAALRRSPHLVDARFSLGCALTGVGRQEEAARAFQEVLRIQPNHPDARYNLATTLHQLGRVPEAIPHYEKVLQGNPRHAPALSNLASALLFSGRLAEAAARAEAAIQVKPDFADAHSNLGLALRRSGKLAEAAASFEAALRHNPDLALARTQLDEIRRGTPASR